MINREAIIQMITSGENQANEQGLIPAMGVYLQQLPTELWNNFLYRMINAVEPELFRSLEILFSNAASECSYHSLGQIIKTPEIWNGIRQFTDGSEEGDLHALFAVISGLGMGDIHVEELIPGEKLVVRAYRYYEGEVLDFGKYPKPCAFTYQGAFASVMDAFYGEQLGDFLCTQTKGIESGDEYGEFVILKATEQMRKERNENSVK